MSDPNHSSSESELPSEGIDDVSEASSVTSYEEDEDDFRIYDNTFDKMDKVLLFRVSTILLLRK